MATEQEEAATASCLWNKGLATPEEPTAVCLGPRLCRTGKTGLVRSSSSFQVKIQLKPQVCQTSGKIRLPATVVEETDNDSEAESESEEEESESEYEEVYETETDEDEE